MATEIRAALRMPPLASEDKLSCSVVQSAVRSSTEKRSGCMCSTIVGRFPVKCRVGAWRTLNSVEQPVLKMGIDWATASLSDMRAALKLPPLASEAKLSCSVGGSPERHNGCGKAFGCVSQPCQCLQPSACRIKNNKSLFSESFRKSNVSQPARPRVTFESSCELRLLESCIDLDAASKRAETRRLQGKNGRCETHAAVH